MTVRTSPINSGTAAFDKHRRSQDFVNVAKVPTARFVADKFSVNGDKVSDVAGTLTLLGKTHPVVLKASHFNCCMSPMLKVEVRGGDFETPLVRSQFGMNWGLDFGIPDNVRRVVRVEAVKRQASQGRGRRCGNRGTPRRRWPQRGVVHGADRVGGIADRRRAPYGCEGTAEQTSCRGHPARRQG